jgi:hypothetical protein
MARPERFELPTFWFVARHSIQLSYGRWKARYYLEAPEARQGMSGCGPGRVGLAASLCNHDPMKQSSDPGRQFRGWRLLGILFVVIVVLAAASFVVDWVVIGPLEGRVF